MRNLVRTHKRQGKNRVSVVVKHFRGKYGPKPKNDKYPARDNASMSMETLLEHYKKYQSEFSKLMSGEWTSSSRHKAFIARRLKTVKRAIQIKRKQQNNSDTN